MDLNKLGTLSDIARVCGNVLNHLSPTHKGEKVIEIYNKWSELSPEDQSAWGISDFCLDHYINENGNASASAILLENLGKAICHKVVNNRDFSTRYIKVTEDVWVFETEYCSNIEFYLVGLDDDEDTHTLTLISFTESLSEAINISQIIMQEF